jgi:hypothetical protein
MKIACAICGRGPKREDGGAAIFSKEPPPGEQRQRYCAECLPLSEVRLRLERQQNGGRLLDADVVAVFEQRLGVGR